MAAAEGWSFEVGDSDFEAEVLERSRQTPVVVDFWAPWCGPCRALGPILETLATEFAGGFLLAKVNVDEAPDSAGRYQVRSIPAVAGFRDGEVVCEFVGAQPESAVRQFLAELIPSPADERVTDGDARLAEGDLDAAETCYQEALELDAKHALAQLGRVRVAHARGQIQEAQQALEQIRTNSAEVEKKIDHLAAQLRTANDTGENEADLRDTLTRDPGDLDARLALGRHLAARDQHEDALSELLEVVKRDSDRDGDAARKTMLDIFELLGNESDVARHYRQQLARALYR
ncbi:thioredoxin [Myxococcota bacterium]|nr:thioredoxin [Myxococcota bacterium]